jgi:CHAT domain-containing protein
MSEFYRLKKENPQLTKAAATQLAQQAMLRGEHKTPAEAGKYRAEIVNSSGQNTNQPAYKKDAKAPFAHPFYWSPFVLIGNWR